MKRFILLVLCALLLGAVAPVRGWAGRLEYDIPPGQSSAPGDDDTPLPLRAPDDEVVRVGHPRNAPAGSHTAGPREQPAIRAFWTDHISGVQIENVLRFWRHVFDKQQIRIPKG